MKEKWNDFSESQWNEIRKMGRLRFSIEYGVMRWGLIMFLVMTSFNFTFNYEGNSFYEIIKFILLNMTIWIVAGYIYGFTIFHFREKLHKKQ